MKILKKIKEKLLRLLFKFLFERNLFDQVLIKKEILTSIIELARSAYPKEFFLVLGGEVKNKQLIVDSLIYQKYSASQRFCTINFQLPLLEKAVGTVHSHPSYSNRPSQADLNTFTKNGFGKIHIIISKPFVYQTLMVYDCFGKPIKWSTI